MELDDSHSLLQQAEEIKYWAFRYRFLRLEQEAI